MSRTPERAAELSPLKRAYLAIEQMESRLSALTEARTEPIAVIGMGCRFPGGADTPEALWGLLSGGVDAVTEVPADRWRLEDFYDPDPNAAGKMYTRWGGFVRDVDKFDQEFFKLSPREIASLDPQQRLLMEVSWEALEYAGQVHSELAGTQTGVFVGISTSDYSLLQLKAGAASRMDIYTGTGQGFCFAAGRLSYMLGLQGPCLSVDTACSSSLVTLHLACQSLRSGECRMAIAGGVNLMLSPEPTIYTSIIRAMAPDGRCKTFDAAADGYVRGEGCGVLILKRLSDALADGDTVLAVVKGSAVNHDGPSGGLTVPNGMAQRAVIRQALENSGVEPSDVSYVEAHGTGTSLGDPIELRALAAVLGEGRDANRPVNVGSIKTNIGHLEAAAGVAGVLKVILSMMHEEIPPHLNLKSLTPHVNWDEIPLAVPTGRTPWPAGERRRIAGVSSFGMSGTNAHVILEEAPRAAATTTAPSEEDGDATEAHGDAPHLLPLSARSPEALRDLARAYKEALAGSGERSLRDVCYTAGVRRTHHEHRLALAATSVEDARGQLESFLQGQTLRTMAVGHKDAARGKLVFAFSGQGSQWHGMGRRLLGRETAFREKVEECDELFRPLAGWSLAEELRGEGEPSRLERTDVAQPAIFALQVALAALWRSWGVEPDAVVGHSLGEVAAAHVAGALSLADAVRVVFHRARLMEQASGLGRMAAVELSSGEAEKVLRGYEGRLALAASNGPASTVLAGEPGALEEVLQALKEKGLRCQMLPVNYAFHSPQMEGARLELVSALEGLAPQTAQVPVFSTVTGERCDGRIFDAAYWGRNVRETVRFRAAVANLLESGHGLFLEVGPHPVLLPAVKETLGQLGQEGSLFASLRREEDGSLNMLSSLGGLYALGRPVEWRRLYPSGGRCVRLPTYTWQRRHFWLAEPPANGNGAAAAPAKKARAHTLPGQLLEPERAGETVWETELDAESLPYLSDHRVRGRVIVPAALYAEMALSAAAVHFESDAVLKELKLHQPLLLRGAEKQTVRLVLTRQADETASFQILSGSHDTRQPETSWTKHATGSMLRGDDDAHGRAPEERESLKEIQERCAEDFTGAEFYQKLDRIGLEYGPCFRPIEGGRRRDGEALAGLSLDPRVASELGTHRMHPVLLDACFQLMAAALPARLTDSQQTALYLPVGFAELRVLRRPGSRLWAHASYRGADAEALADVLEGDVRLLDEAGEVVAEVTGLRQQRVTRVPSHDERETARWLYEVRWLPEELKSAADDSGRRGPGRWLIFADAGGVAERLAERLTARGESCVMVFAGESLKQTRRDERREDFVVNPSSAEEVREIVAKVSDSSGPPLRAVCHLWSCDAKPPADSAEDDSRGARTADCASLLHLVKALDRTARAESPRLWLVTAGAQPILDDEPISVAQQPVWGLGRVIAREHQRLRCSLVDLSPSSTREEVDALLGNFLAEDAENQIALRGGGRYVARLLPHQPEEAAPHAATLKASPAEQTGEVLTWPSGIGDDEAVRLEIARTGSLDNLSLRTVGRRAPRAGEVEIEIEAAGLNFRDIMKSLGVYPCTPGTPLWLGDECAGRVVRCGEGVEGLKVGDDVIAAAPGSFATTTTTSAAYVCPRPRGLSAEEAATIPIAFTTAYHALCNVARLAAGERVLIHAAAGGVGLAAVQIAQWLGAEIFATAGSDEKRDFLKSLGVRHVMDTRSLRFAGQVMELTGGAGVDVVLNSLSGEAIASSLSVLGRFGRFVEIGKRDIYEDSKLGLLPFRNNLSFFAIDLELIFKERPDFAARLLREVVQRFDEGVLRPLPLRVFNVAEAVGAFRHMAQRRNIGKVVISLANRPAEQAPESVEVSAGRRVDENRHDSNSEARPPFDTDGAYLITGGLGALGLMLARWMAARGAGRLYLLGRGEPSVEARDVLRRLREDGVEVTALRADVADAGELSAALQEIDAAGVELRGVVHAAGVLDDCTVSNMDAERLNRVLRPKVDGAWNLHRLTRGKRLDFFVLFSSAASLLGSPGQGNYAAANAFLDGLAHYRRRAGLPALSLNWGAWAQAGMAATAEQKSRFARLGVGAIEPDEGLEIFGRLVGGGARQVLVLPADWQRLGASLAATGPTSFFSELTRDGAAQPNDSRAGKAVDGQSLKLIFSTPEGERGAALESYLRTQLARVVGLKPAQIDARRPLGDFGFDSLIAMELVLSVENNLGLRLPMESLTHDTSLAQLAELSLPLLKEGAAPSASSNGDAAPHAREATGAHPAAEENGAGGHSERSSHAVSLAEVEAEAAARLPELDETAYEEYVRPQFARVLAALKLDRTYVWAEGDRVAYEEDGRRVEVLDMVGGYGSTLFGHNHPELVAYARELLAARIPIQSQGSIRSAAGTLARDLSERVKAETGRDYMCVFANSGAETIEAAIKHAALEYIKRGRERKAGDERAFALLAHRRRLESETLPEALVRELGEALGAPVPRELHAAQRALAEHNEKARESMPLFLALGRSFHGKTLGALSLTANPLYRGSFLDEAGLRVEWIEMGDAEGLRRAVESERRYTYTLAEDGEGRLELLKRRWTSVGAIFVEPVQGEGGIHINPAAFCAEIQALAEGDEFPVVLDEIQSGMGRCGSFMASQRLGLRGDYYTLAKSLGGGLAKIGALLIDRTRYEQDFGSIHTSTFAEDDFASRLALKALEILDRDRLVARCEAGGNYLLERLRALQTRYPTVVKEVRGMGLMAGVELAEQTHSSSKLIRFSSEQQTLSGLAAGYLLNEERIRTAITLSSLNTIRLEPSAYISNEDLDTVVGALERLCQIIERANAGRLVRYLAEEGQHDSGEPVADWRSAHDDGQDEDEDEEGVPRAAFFGHLIDDAHLTEWDASLAELTPSGRREFLRRIHRFVKPSVTRRVRIRSAQGRELSLRLVSWIATSSLIEEAMRTGETGWLLDQLTDALEEAREDGCQVVGFGGYLSIVSQNCKRVATTEASLTTGNAYTIAMGLEALRQAARERGIDLKKSRLAAVGAGGNICSTYLRVMAEEVPELTLIGRKQSEERMAKIAVTLYREAWGRIRARDAGELGGLAAAIFPTRSVQCLLAGDVETEDAGRWLFEQLREEFGGHRFIRLAEDLSALADCDIVVTASNSATPIIFPEHFSPRPTIVCDISVPPDVSPEVAERCPDALVLKGGVVRLPLNDDFVLKENPLPAGHMYACMAETTLLGLEGYRGHFSFGDVSADDVRWILEVGRKHGYQLGYLKSERTL
ncbi:MAG TPA: aminotransferase class III-fold pyridoxal phosphate-dependent enzyme [Pyrinomonadaceae bacterium]|jgi:acyl transferase domain-containing protein/acetylornithine/succinyldiaminopimelate/putrescine aminotransferase/predicted amino acid dehydrogenase/acyl carrier protein